MCGFRGTLTYAAGKFLRRGGIVELNIIKLRPAIHEVHVSVVEARQEPLPARIDQASVGPAPCIHLLARSDGNNAVPENSNRLSLGSRRIDGPDAHVLDDEVGCWLGLREDAP